MKRIIIAKKLHHLTFAIVSLFIPVLLFNLCCDTNSKYSTPVPEFERICPSQDGTHFVHALS